MQGPMTAQIPATGLESFTDAKQAVDRLVEIYDRSRGDIIRRFEEYAASNGNYQGTTRAWYPWLGIKVDGPPLREDPAISWGFCAESGDYGTTITRPDLFREYLDDQINNLFANHGTPVLVGQSQMGMPVHFAFADDIATYTRNMSADMVRGIPRHFDVPDLAYMDDMIVNCTYEPVPGDPAPLSLFTGPRIDYSLHRLRHYTGVGAEHFQSFVLFTNYQFYVEEFVRLGKELMNSDEDHGYTAFVEPGPVITEKGGTAVGDGLPRLPQMPSWHLKRKDGQGITLVNIGVGPSNAKTITDHIAVLRPHCWLMLGHCAGLRSTQRLGDYVLAHGYVREDHVLDEDLPLSVPVPAIAEVQQALEKSVADIAGLSDRKLKKLMRTGTVATIDDRNWELRDYRVPMQRLSQSRAIALDMESATIAANGFRFRVPYGTLLCVSDKPLHGEIKLPGMADQFYRDRVDQHLQIGIRTMELLREMGSDKLHSRKLRSFAEPAMR